MPALGIFWSSLMLMIGPLVYKIVTALGVGFVTYSVSKLGTETLLEYVQAKLAGLPVDLLALVARLRLDEAIGLIASAYSVRAAMAGWRMWEGRMSKRTTVWHEPGSNPNLPA